MMTNHVPLPSGKYVVMGSGDFAVGGCICSVTGMDGIIYVPLDDQRPINADCSDLFPPGSIQENAAAVIYFKNESAIRQSIQVMNEVLEQHLQRNSKICGRINSGHVCDMPTGSRCPDCGPSYHDVGEGA